MPVRSAVLLAAALLAPAVGAAPPRTEAPIREVDLSNGTRRYAVSLMVNGRQVEAGLDTGSTGLRILPRGFAGDAPGGGAPVSIGYGAGAELRGRVARISLAIGATSGNDIVVQRVEKVGCTARHPDCAAGRVPMEQYGIQGDGLPGEGFAAILGINLADNPVGNPLVALGAERWIIELPRPGSPASGRLILDPTDEDLAGYRMVPITGVAGADGGLHDAVAACLIRADPHVEWCGHGLFDTGAPGIRIAGESRAQPWPDGTAATFAIVDGQRVAATLPLVIGRRDEATALRTEQESGARPLRLYLGLMPYFGWSVLYDVKARAIGVRPR